MENNGSGTAQYWAVEVEIAKGGEWRSAGRNVVPCSRVPDPIDAITAEGISPIKLPGSAGWTWVESETPDVYHPVGVDGGAVNREIRATVKRCDP